MKRKKNEIEEELDDENNASEVDEELSEKELKKKKQKESVEKRKNARRKDKVARWGGIILLGLMMFVGFLLWVFGEMSSEGSDHGQVINSSPEVYKQRTVKPETQQGSVIVK